MVFMWMGQHQYINVIHSIVLHGGFDGVLSVIGAIASIYHHGFAAGTVKGYSLHVLRLQPLLVSFGL